MAQKRGVGTGLYMPERVEFTLANPLANEFLKVIDHLYGDLQNTAMSWEKGGTVLRCIARKNDVVLICDALDSWRKI